MRPTVDEYRHLKEQMAEIQHRCEDCALSYVQTFENIIELPFLFGSASSQFYLATSGFGQYQQFAPKRLSVRFSRVPSLRVNTITYLKLHQKLPGGQRNNMCDTVQT